MRFDSPGVDLWRVRELLAARYPCDPARLEDRLGLVLAELVNEIGLVWPSATHVRAAVLTRWPELEEAPRRGRRAAGVSPSWVRRALARHPDWRTVGYRRRLDGTRGVAVRALAELVRARVGLDSSTAEAVELASKAGLIAYPERPEKTQLEIAANPLPMQLSSFGKDTGNL